MKIIDAEWTPRYNKLVIECSCGKVYKARADRWYSTCPRCKNRIKKDKLILDIRRGNEKR